MTSHIGFRKACRAQAVEHSKLPYRAPLGIWGSVIALCFMSIVIIFKGAEVFVHGFDYKNFIVQYIGIPVYLFCIFGFKIVKRSRRVRAEQVDLVTGVPTEPIEDELARVKAEEELKKATHGKSNNMLHKLYQSVLSYLF